MKTKTKGFLLTASVCLAMAFTLSCSSDDWLGDPSSSSNGGGDPSSSSNGGGDPSSSSNGGGEPSSSSGGGGNSIIYEDETYPTVDIGTQTWLAKNLNYAVEGSKCYDNDPDYCVQYGRLYDWETALTVCPSGWHLPSDDDWDKLFLYVDSQNDGEGSGGSPYDSYTAGKYLKATSGWNEYCSWNEDDDCELKSGNGTDKYGFSALPGGYGDSGGSFNYVGDYGFWWSASENDSYGAYYRIMYYDSEYAYWLNGIKSLLFSVRCVKD